VAGLLQRVFQSSTLKAAGLFCRHLQKRRTKENYTRIVREHFPAKAIEQSPELPPHSCDGYTV